MDVGRLIVLASSGLAAIGLVALGPVHANTRAQTEASIAPAEPVHFARARSQIVLDGRLDDAVWAEAAPVTRFVETYPGNLALPPVNTEARFAYDDKYVYIGIRAYDSGPSNIVSSLVRRDQVLTDQDYVEILLDPLKAQNSAFLFRTNAQGVATDGLFNEEQQIRDYSPDFNFDVKAARDAEGWTAEFRIPLSTLRYEAGDAQSWSFVIYRNLPRANTLTISSAPIPRGANCVLCFADEVDGISLERRRTPIDITPQITYSRRTSDSEGNSQIGRAGVDAKWQLRPDTVADLTIAPDFSQVEADDLQLTANQRFALSVTEKRPFFLESADLLSTPIIALYTRAFTDPDAGLRITQRNDKYEYTAMLLRDAGGGTVIEPGPIASGASLQDFESTAFVGRYKIHRRDMSLGTLATARLNDDGSQNLVYGVDTTWQLSTSDRITAQLLGSQTLNPDRPDLLPSWTGQRLNGAAGSLRWEHSVESWYSYLSYNNLSHDFRTWNGFVTRVGVSNLVGTGSYYFYPKSRFVTRLGPTLTFSSYDEPGGGRLSRSFSPGFSFQGARNTSLSLSWTPGAQDITPVGLRSYDTYSVSLVTSPFSWMPQALLHVSTGDTLDMRTGEVGDGLTVQADIPLRLFSRLELVTSFDYQSLDSRRPELHPKRLFTQRNTQLNAIWHFSSRMYAQGLYQSSTFTSAPSSLQAAPIEPPTDPPDEPPVLQARTSTQLSSFLLSYQKNWQTRYFLGVRHSENGESETEVFAKLSYVFSR